MNHNARNSIAAALGFYMLLGCAQMQVADRPQFRVDPDWPQPFAEDKGVQLILGQVAGIAVGRNGHRSEERRVGKECRL